ncbi:pyridoxamine 5'-phosphate oxidase family protein [Geomonas edaphica]|uniref:pyridoxamine 5'-phosphate oxidase family protein n=1 Tax=Geomonas edaphica TaxID=2570226 RepID=UPI0010A7B59F|nr:pyridoxamine 5'-phosphate oxidase family protein [Geomonas edaphica]
MSVTIPKEAAQLLKDPETVKVLATVDEAGFPHLAVKQSLYLDESERLVYTELLESSRTNRNLVRSSWFGDTVSVLVSGPEGRSFLVKGRPVKTLIAGPVFRSHYKEIRCGCRGGLDHRA